MKPTFSQPAVNPQYNQLQQQLAQTQPQTIVVLPGAVQTTIGVLTKEQFIRSTYESMQKCCCCTYRFWALFGWIWSLIFIIIGCIVAAIFVFLTDAIFVLCEDVSDVDSDPNNTTDDTKFCAYPLMISCILLVVCVIELICISIIIHGIRKYNYNICILGAAFSGLNAFASFGGITTTTGGSIAGFGFFGVFFMINAFHTYYVKIATDIWNKRVKAKDMSVNAQ